MKKLLAIFITLALMVGCVTMPNAQDQFPTELQRSVAVFDSVNNKIFGEAFRPSESMANFDLTRYEGILASLKSDRAKELREILESYEIKSLKSFDNTYIFCIYSSEQGFAMCDDARCSGVEKKGLSASPQIIETWMRELPLSSCPKH